MSQKKFFVGMRGVFYLAMAGLVGFSAAGCKKQPVFERPPALVTVIDANSSDVPVYLDEIGTCTASEVVSIRPQVTGQIKQIHFTDGADVKRGDMLFTIDPRPFQASFAQAQASLTQDTALLGLAESEFERGEKLISTAAISKEDYETRKNTLAVARAKIEADKAAIETAQVNLDYCFIHSPIDGRASLRQVDVGNVVTAATGAGSSSSALLTIQRLDPIYVDFTITERDLSAVRKEMAGGMLKVVVRLPDDPENKMHEGELTFLDNAVQENTGTVKVRATLANGEHYFWPGQFVRARIVLSTMKDAVIVPNAATAISQNGPYVYVIGPDMIAELRLVKVGQRQGDMVVIVEGLKAGEKVVMRGQLGVTPGGKVHIQEPEKQGSPKPTGPAGNGKEEGKP
jgi:multidrug efflux system membrane fusion protein